MYLSLDMGTSNTRLWLCDNNGVVATATAAFGAGSKKAIGKMRLFAELKNLIDTLLSDNSLSNDAISYILTAGMAGSELGLLDIPHICVPADIYMLAEHLHKHTIPEITTIPFVFVPGLKKAKGDMLEDIMRGEETESVGIWNALPVEEDSVLVLPGTHNKVIHLRIDGTITDFYTTFSGELLNNIIANSILSGQVTHTFEISEVYVLRGAAYAQENGLNAALFHIRVMAKNALDKDSLSSFLYGCIIGQDTERILKFAAGKPIFIGGRSALKQVYHILLGERSIPLADDISANAVNKGLSAVHRLYQTRQRRSAVLQSIEEEKLIAIVRNPDIKSFLPAMQALYRGGIRLAEITFDRSGNVPKEYTAQLIRLLNQQLPMIVGAGTVTEKEEVMLAYNAGASYIISPNCDPEIIRFTQQLGMVSIPAAFTPTEIVSAIKSGADYVKLFPADQLSESYIKSVKAPLPDAKLLAVGGVNKGNAGTFIRQGFSGVGVGSNLYDKKLIAHGDWSKLETLARAYVSAIKA